MMEETQATDDTANVTAAKRTFGEIADDTHPETPEPKRPKPSPDLSDVETLDSEGDVVLAIEKPDSETQEKFLVSSRVLSLASPVFRRMFSPSFTEGRQVRNGDVPCISLEEDDAEAMRTILRLLHFRRDNMPFELGPQALAKIALHCDKYDVIASLEAWVQIWLDNSKFRNFATYRPEEIGLALLGGYMLDRSELWLSDLASEASKYLMPDFVSVWEQHEDLSILPETLATRMSDHISQNLSRLQDTLLRVDESLRQTSKGYLIPGSRVCPPCGETFPGQVEKCQCGQSLVDRYCTVESRVAEYFALLRRFDLYPFVTPFSTCSLDDIDGKIAGMYALHGHTCDGLFDCPLAVAISRLDDESRTVRTAVDFAWNCDGTEPTETP
ncbi:hypothetical protein CONLIGDRAFT_672449 [Coniochaeta ligniaria NRRL 30616]|uniref:BTB domain-containing protein n=1 Tax=Coniochaeta ligniaria NRRL 30616 TaxID=1408157 RepID=A0A1J7IIB5_9PEZI|nr:hypothetical protein CONLIGDRAFT_672449 [Coniochaeta ligniaria NRRL 30616]